MAFPRVVSSGLIEIECRRVLHRCRLASELGDETLAVARERLDAVLAGIDLLEMSTPERLLGTCGRGPEVARPMMATSRATAAEPRRQARRPGQHQQCGAPPPPIRAPNDRLCNQLSALLMTRLRKTGGRKSSGAR